MSPGYKWWTSEDWRHDLQMIAMLLGQYGFYRALTFYNLDQITYDGWSEPKFTFSHNFK